jgi:hypothetical protein
LSLGSLDFVCWIVEMSVFSLESVKSVDEEEVGEVRDVIV